MRAGRSCAGCLRFSRVVRVVTPAAAVGDVRLRQHLRSIARLTGGQLNTDRADAPTPFENLNASFPALPIINRLTIQNRELHVRAVPRRRGNDERFHLAASRGSSPEQVTSDRAISSASSLG